MQDTTDAGFKIQRLPRSSFRGGQAMETLGDELTELHNGARKSGVNAHHYWLSDKVSAPAPTHRGDRQML